MTDCRAGASGPSDRRWLHAAAPCHPVHDARRGSGARPSPRWPPSVFGSEVEPRIQRETTVVPGLSLLDPAPHARLAGAPWRSGSTASGVWGLRSYEKLVPGASLRAAAGSDRPVPAASLVDGRLRTTVAERSWISRDLLRDEQPQPCSRRAGAPSQGWGPSALGGPPQRVKGRDQYHVRVSGRSPVLRFAEAVGAVGRLQDRVPRGRRFLARCSAGEHEPRRDPQRCLGSARSAGHGARRGHTPRSSMPDMETAYAG